MNIFYLHEDPVIAAKMQTNKHVVKMILESAQLLSTAHRVLDGEHYIDSSSGRKIQRWRLPEEKENILYKATHFNHPCALWTMESIENYKWLYKHFLALSEEYNLRYNKQHKSWVELREILSFTPVNIPLRKFTTPALAMPEEYVRGRNAVDAYRAYYEAEKLKEQEDINRYNEFI